MDIKRELRMYGLTPYQLNGRQIGIQFGHSVVEYGLKYFNEDLYQDWANNYKTFIILNGGISNHSINRETHLSTLIENDIKISTFYEPDLNDMLSAITFIVDERVFNKELYPDITPEDMSKISISGIPAYDEWKMKFNDNEAEVNKIIFLRQFLSKFRLA
jgi:hypothetical protein